MLLPNRNTIGLVALLVAMWYAGASQNNAAAYLLGFVLASVAAVSAVHAWANLRGVTLSAETIAPVFAGEDLCLRLVARTQTRRSHPALRVKMPGSAIVTFDEVRREAPARAELYAPAEERGRFETVKVRLGTRYPLGFFTALRRVVIRQPHFVYPRPEGSLPLPRPRAPRHRGAGFRAEGDDFAGTRAYQRGESQRHIDWKAAARGQPLLIKQWAGEADEILDLDWDHLAPLEHEARLSQLARWVVMAERGGASYGLRLPSLTVAPGRDEAHFHECLRALALFPREEKGPV